MKWILIISIAFFYQCKPTETSNTTSTVEEPIAEQVQKPEIKSTTVAGAKAMIENEPNLVIIDVRTPEEYAEGTLPNAINIDVRNGNFDNMIKILDKSGKYLVHCRSGSRSLKASEIMIEKGFKDVTNMEGGYLQWVEEQE